MDGGKQMNTKDYLITFYSNGVECVFKAKCTILKNNDFYLVL